MCKIDIYSNEGTGVHIILFVSMGVLGNIISCVNYWNLNKNAVLILKVIETEKEKNFGKCILN